MFSRINIYRACWKSNKHCYYRKDVLSEKITTFGDPPEKVMAEIIKLLNNNNRLTYVFTDAIELVYLTFETKLDYDNFSAAFLSKINPKYIQKVKEYANKIVAFAYEIYLRMQEYDYMFITGTLGGDMNAFACSLFLDITASSKMIVSLDKFIEFYEKHTSSAPNGVHVFYGETEDEIIDRLYHRYVRYVFAHYKMIELETV